MASEPADPRDPEQPTERPASVTDRDTAPSSTDTESDAAPTTPRSGLPPLPSEDVEVDLPSDPATERREPRTRIAVQRRSGEDTLLSLPAPADGDEPASYEPRVDELERRLSAIEARIAVLEIGSGQLSKSGKRWLGWIAFMVTLAVAWQIVRQYR
jgi:hypothetical protein